MTVFAVQCCRDMVCLAVPPSLRLFLVWSQLP